MRRRIIILIMLYVYAARGQTIFEAIERREVREVKAALVQDPDAIHRVDENGKTPLHTAAGAGLSDILSVLIDHGAQCDAKDSQKQTPLFSAVSGGHTDIVVQLIRHGADLNSRDGAGWTPLSYAAYTGHVSITEKLLKSGADQRIGEEGAGWLPIHAAAFQGHLDVVETLSQDRSVLSIDAGKTGNPLHWAVVRNRKAVTELLISRGADIDLPNPDGLSPFLMAVSQGHVEMAKLLMRHGANMTLRDNKYDRTALHLAAIQKHPEMVPLLLEAGIGWSHRDRFGKTAMDWARRLGHSDVVDALKTAGVVVPSRGPLHITHVANAGFMMGTSSSARVMIDCPMHIENYSDQQFLHRMERLTGGEPHFRDVDIVLITHPHQDHFDPNLTADFLLNNEDAAVVGPGTLLERFELYEEDVDKFGHRVFTVNLQIHNKVSLSANGLKVTAISTLHEGEQAADSDRIGHLAYLFDMGGWKVLHTGDWGNYEDEPADFAPYAWLAGESIDVMFTSYIFLISPMGKEIINTCFNPRYVIPMHYHPDRMPAARFQNIEGLHAEVVTYDGLFASLSLSDPSPFEGSSLMRFDWREKGILTPVKHQQNLGSCGVFAAVAVVEALIKRETGKTVDLSEQHIINGSHDWVPSGISSVDAMKFMKNHGIVTERRLPYRDRQTDELPDGPPDNRLSDYHYIKTDKLSLSEKIRTIKDAVFRFGPVATNMIFYEDLDRYTNGVYVYDGKAEEQGGHWVVIVGWQDDTEVKNGGYWICRNSWGGKWGMDGYFNIAYGECGIDDFWFVYGMISP